MNNLQPDSITQGAKKLKYTYGLSLNRVKSSYYESNTLKETRYYLGDYEIQQIGDTTREIHYINASTGLVAMVVKENNEYNYYYTATDHLGSITTVMDEEGEVVAEQSFDAWGRRRNANSWSTDTTSVVPTWLYRGYTGHEMLDSFQLINMNGRLYDPVIARMLSPDPFVQAPNSLQNYNRYSYVMNNPLSYTDPSGYNYSSSGKWVDSYSTNFYEYNDANHTGWDPSMGFTAMFNIVSNQYGTLAAMMAANSGFSSGPGMGFGSSFSGRGITTTISYVPIIKSFTSYTCEKGIFHPQIDMGEDIVFSTTYERGILSSVDIFNNAVASNGETQSNQSGHRKPRNTNNNYLRMYHFNELSTNPNEEVRSIYSYYNYYKNYTLNQLLNENSGKGSNSRSGTIYRFIYDPLYSGVIIDMKHFLNSIVYPSIFGKAKEVRQSMKENPSAFNPQDYYSNNLGNEFLNFYNSYCRNSCNSSQIFNDPNIMFMIKEFLTIKVFRNGR